MRRVSKADDMGTLYPTANNRYPANGGGGSGDDDDDIYSGFKTSQSTYGYNAPIGTASGVPGTGYVNPGVGAAGGNTANKPPATAMQIPRTGFVAPGTGAGGRPGTGMQPPGTASGGAGGGVSGEGGLARPMTSNRGAGYSSGGASAQSRAVFDPLKQGPKGAEFPLYKKVETPETVALDMEKEVNRLLEESAELASKKDFPQALERAKEAGKKERALMRHRELSNLTEGTNYDLTYAVIFNLAVQYENNEQYTEAMNTHTILLKNKQYSQSPQLRINIGNICFAQKKFQQAIKMYRMALDQIPSTSRSLRFKIMRNIGNTFVRLNQYQDAIQSYETVMDGAPELQTGMNLLLCYFALGDRDKMKKGFVKLLSIPTPRTVLVSASHQNLDSSQQSNSRDLLQEETEEDNEEVLKSDDLREELRVRERELVQTILRAARLIAPALGDWSFVIEQVRAFELNTKFHMDVELEMSRCVDFLKQGSFHAAIDAMKEFERKNEAYKARAATNLSYLYFLEGDIENARKYATLAVEVDKYNAKALVNKGNCAFFNGEYEEARQTYLDAIEAEADCVEAIYNYALCSKRQGRMEDALRAFRKLLAIMPDSVEVMWQIADLHDALDQEDKALEMYTKLISRVPTDANVLARIGGLYARQGDESRAYHYHLESYRYLPVSMDVISWLGAYFVKSEVYEKAMAFFERASEIQPHEVKWKLMVASCLRRIGSYQPAKKLYEDIHKQHPENAECLRYLVHICNDLGLKDEAIEYHNALSRVEMRKASEAQLYQQDQPPAVTDPEPIDDAVSKSVAEQRQQQQMIQQQRNANVIASSGKPLKRPSTASRKATSAPKQQDDDDWGNEELGDELLPM
eukprot:ANDGO_05212.mRNA.1 UDP-N-acetylglucosamine--peptide N-acetylglucosaminyltransferase